MQNRAQHKYTITATLGKGTYGTVFEALNETRTKVAIKKLFGRDASNSGVDRTALREVKYLRDVRHPNIIRLLDVYFQHSALHLVMELCRTDLAAVVYNNAVFISPADTRCYVRQLLCGVEFLHSRFMLHRDLKPGNLLISPRGLLKLADFGLARSYGSPLRMTTGDRVMTSGYRPPEIIFGSPFYSASADVWSVGCIIMEIALRAPLFPAESDVGQLGKIFQLLGTPTEATWPGVSKLDNFINMEARQEPSATGSVGGGRAVTTWPVIPLRPVIPPQQSHQTPQQYQQTVAVARQRHAGMVEEAFGLRAPLGRIFDNYQPASSVHTLLSLVQSLLVLNPLRRLTATKALAHPYFSDGPTTPPHQLKLPFAVTMPTADEEAAEKGYMQSLLDGGASGRAGSAGASAMAGGHAHGGSSPEDGWTAKKRIKLETPTPPEPPAP